MTDLPEHEERQVRDYVNSQSPKDDQVTLVQKVGTRRILSRVHELYDVHCEQSRWWVISDPMNLYSQEHFPELEVALTFHLGLALRLTDDSRTETDVERERRVSGAWRRFEQAAEAMDSASEAADFQAVGVRCREALLALVQGQADEPWLGGIEDPPKRSDFKGWGAILAERLGEGRLRAYVKDLVDGTWVLRIDREAEERACQSDGPALHQERVVAEPTDDGLDQLHVLDPLFLEVSVGAHAYGRYTGHCCVGRSQGEVDRQPRTSSDHEGQFGERVGKPGGRRHVGPEVVEAPAEVLDERVRRDDDPGGPVAL